ncbi:hypothetical protein AB0I75_32060 [Streptomyces sp. NPDC050273]|uniref:hypothetical protein n=1 Tax=Streptomyces sp. NPDC050273 TaxID=3154933 RepID=UPI00343EDBD6
MNTARGMTAVVLTGVAVLTATSCDPYPAGPAGQVQSREQKHDPATHAQRFELTVKTPHGSARTFQVTVDDYDACRANAAYPACTQR